MSTDRLYLALYSRDGLSPSALQRDDRHHWALLAIPASSHKATRFHARDFFSSPDETHWLYEEIHVDARGTPKLLTKTLIGDINDWDGFFEILRDVPLDQEMIGWNCLTWIRDALRALGQDAAVVSGRSGVGSWSRLRRVALAAADAEKERRDAVMEALKESQGGA
jgi:hypothetical protein